LSDLIAAARSEALRLQHDYVGTEHLLLALIRNSDPSLATILTAFSTTPDALLDRLEKRSPPGKGAPSDPDDLALRSGARRALDAARASAEGGDPAPRHVLAALLADGKGIIAASLGDLGIPVAKVRDALGGPTQAAPATGVTERADQAGRTDRPARPERTDRQARPQQRERKEKEKEKERGGKRERGERGPERGEGRGSREDERRPGAPASPPRIAPVHEPFFTWRKLPWLAVVASIYLGHFGHFPPLLVFITACVAVLPLASYMGEATEHLAARTGPTLGGFLNATFGNAAELIIAIVALRAGMVELVKASITGSILGNLLLILGLSLVAGGLNKPTIRFNRTAAGMSSGMLALAVTGLVFPALFHGLYGGQNAAVLELRLSEAVAVVLAVTYGFSLLFSLKTHSRVFAGEPHPTESHLWSVPAAIAVLGLATVGVAVESEILVHSVQQLTNQHAWVSETFLGLIVIPIIGNAAEHATAIVVARKGKVDLALNIAMGSSTQVALLVAPVLVFIGLLVGPNAAGQYMNLVFTPIEVVAVTLSTILTAIVILDGESHWFEGVQLLALYAMVAIAVFFI
jgi:Ca2+:H+ antiporter